MSDRPSELTYTWLALDLFSVAEVYIVGISSETDVRRLGRDEKKRKNSSAV